MIRWFEIIVILSILCNSVCLAAYDYNDRTNKNTRNQVIDQMGLFFNAIFMFEFILKLISYGFLFHPKSYLRDGWNIIDFIVIVSAILDFVPSLSHQTKSI